MKATKLMILSLLSCGLILTGCGNNNDNHEHTWSAPTYVWSSDYSSCRAERICADDATHVESEVVESVYTVLTESTCESDGLGKYTATFTNSAFTAQTHDEVIAKGHNFQFNSFVWTDYTAQAKYVCSKDDSHVELHDATITSEITTAPTCEVEGIRTYTASYDGHTDTKTENISVLGHEYHPITGQCLRDGCDATLALGRTIQYGEGTLQTVSFSNGDYVRDEKHIFDFVFEGDVASTNLVIGFNQGEATGIFKTNCNIAVYDEDYNLLEVNAFSSNAIYSLEHQFVSGEHIYVHVTLKYSDFTDVNVYLTTHQYTGLRAVAKTYKTCVSPSINAHVEFDQSSVTDSWLDINARVEKNRNDFKVGEAGSGHNFTHHVATEATTTSPALKEHWYCSKCGCYFLSEKGGEEVAYEDLYDNTLYGIIEDVFFINGRGTALTVRVIVDNGEEPIQNVDPRYINQIAKCVFEDGSISAGNVIADISVNVHIVQFLLRGLDYATVTAKNPKAFFINL